MNNIKRTEDLIKAGKFSEVAYPFRAYALITSEEHLAAGSDWQLVFSAPTREEVERMVAGSTCYGNPKLYTVVIVEGPAAGDIEQYERTCEALLEIVNRRGS